MIESRLRLDHRVLHGRALPKSKAKSKSKVKPKQLELVMPTRGGRREGAGRKLERPRATVAHVKRVAFRAEHPVLVTMRVRKDVPCLRARPAWAVVVKAMRGVRERGDFRVVHYSVMGNHIHAIVEADGHEAFVAGMRALTIRLARGLNAHWGRTGQLFDHRYDARALRSPREVRNALQYVLLNARKHAAERGEMFASDWIDDRSTGVCFDGWAQRVGIVCSKDFGIAQPQTWLLRTGWRKHGLLHIDAIPGGVAFDSAIVRAA